MPNKKWLTDITEFSIPAGKIYLSPVIDCFDGMIVSNATGSIGFAVPQESALLCIRRGY